MVFGVHCALVRSEVPAPESSRTPFFSLTMLLTASATPEFGTSTMTSTLSTSNHWRAMLTPTSGLFVMIAGDDVDLPALGRHAGILDRHLRRQRRAGAAEIGVKAGLIAQRADLHGLVLRERKTAAGKRQRRSKQQMRIFYSSYRSPLRFLWLLFSLFRRRFRRRDRCEACPYWPAAPHWRSRR